MLKFAAAFSDRERAEQLASTIGGTLYCDERDNIDHLPFAALVTGTSDDLPWFLAQAETGAWLIHQRVIKARPDSHPTQGKLPGRIGVFTLVAHPELGRQQSDQHWRDNHAPLALQIHTAMSHYTQLSVLHRFTGPEWDGFALCGFESMQDLRERFYDSPEGEKKIAEDIRKFADTRRSPRRIIAVETVYAGT